MGKKSLTDGIALFFRAPHRYTGEDVIELSCHGGDAVARRLVEACLAEPAPSRPARGSTPAAPSSTASSA